MPLTQMQQYIQTRRLHLTLLSRPNPKCKFAANLCHKHEPAINVPLQSIVSNYATTIRHIPCKSILQFKLISTIPFATCNSILANLNKSKKHPPSHMLCHPKQTRQSLLYTPSYEHHDVQANEYERP